jgi:hypothetical protein
VAVSAELSQQLAAGLDLRLRLFDGDDRSRTENCRTFWNLSGFRNWTTLSNSLRFFNFRRISPSVLRSDFFRAHGRLESTEVRTNCSRVSLIGATERACTSFELRAERSSLSSQRSTSRKPSPP